MDAELMAKLEQIERSDWREKVRLIRELEAQPSEELIDALIQMLAINEPRDENSKINMAAGDALLRIGETAFQRLLAVLAQEYQQQHTNQVHYYWIVETIGIFQDQRAVPVLRAALRSPMVAVVEAAAEVLVWLKDKAALPIIEQLLQQRPFPDGYVYTALKDARKALRAYRPND